jgi:hypothetical protein
MADIKSEEGRSRVRGQSIIFIYDIGAYIHSLKEDLTYTLELYESLNSTTE